jgi:hypothetical protein
VTIDDPALPCVVELGIATTQWTAHCTSLFARARPDGAPITGDLLRRIPVARLTQLALARCLRRVVGPPSSAGARAAKARGGQVTGEVVPIEGLAEFYRGDPLENPDEVFRAAAAWAVVAVHDTEPLMAVGDRPVRGRPVPEDRFAEFVALANECRRTGDPIAPAARARLLMTTDQVKKWTKRAKDAGLLEEEQ